MGVDVTAACAGCFSNHAGDCSGFVRAVAACVGIDLSGNADEIVDTVRTDPRWTILGDGAAAAVAAWQGQLVVAGMKGAEQSRPCPHGHVAVVVPGVCAHGVYPYAFWGSLGGAPGRNQTINYAWVAADRDRVTYAAYKHVG